MINLKMKDRYEAGKSLYKKGYINKNIDLLDLFY